MTKWQGVCLMCGGKDLNVSTTMTSLGPIRFWIRICCDHCQRVMQVDIDHTMMILRADRKQLDHEREEKEK